MNGLFFDCALLADGWADRVRIEVADDGRIAALASQASPDGADVCAAVGLPGLANVHSHAFQRGMAGLTERPGPTSDSFWTWRETMYRFLDRLTPDDVEALAGQLYVEMLEAGFTAVGEFHYLHHAPDGRPYDDPAEMCGRIVAAARTAGIGLTLLPVLYQHGGFDGRSLQPQQRRFATDLDSFAKLHEAAGRLLRDLPYAALGVAPHSLRAVDSESLSKLVETYRDGPIHLHIAEQRREVEECQAANGSTPVAWLLDRQPVDARWCLIHATHLTPAETESLARSGAVVGLCPQSEANLGDGVFDGARFLTAGGKFGIGSDSHIRVDAAEELRTLEYSQRLRELRRNLLAADGRSTGRTLYECAARDGSAAIGRDAGVLAPGKIADIVALDATHPLLVGRSGDAILDTWVFCGDRSLVQDVWVAGRRVVREGRHDRREESAAPFRAVCRRLME